jgi:hypothetical protein
VSVERDCASVLSRFERDCGSVLSRRFRFSVFGSVGWLIDIGRVWFS